MSNIIVKPPSLLAATHTNDVAAAFQESIAGQYRITLDLLPMWSIDHKGKAFKFGDIRTEKLVGYPVFWSKARAYWKVAYDPKNTGGPDCWSIDGLTPSKAARFPQAPTCETSCQWSQWGSDPRTGKGQACRVTTNVFLVNPEFGNPPVAWFSAPPTSYRSLVGSSRAPGYLIAAKFTQTPTGERVGMHELVWSEFTLEEGGPIHCVVKGKALGVCTDKTEAQLLARLRGIIIDMWQANAGVAMFEEHSDRNGPDHSDSTVKQTNDDPF